MNEFAMSTYATDTGAGRSRGSIRLGGGVVPRAAGKCVKKSSRTSSLLRVAFGHEADEERGELAALQRVRHRGESNPNPIPNPLTLPVTSDVPAACAAGRA
eukprot:scaffold46908_cov48-Phaeocystis_antarctica.AAC.1